MADNSLTEQHLTRNTPTASEHQAAKYRLHTKEGGETKILHLFLIFVYQPEHKAAIDGNTLNGTGHTATETERDRATQKDILNWEPPQPQRIPERAETLRGRDPIQASSLGDVHRS